VRKKINFVHFNHLSDLKLSFHSIESKFISIVYQFHEIPPIFCLFVYYLILQQRYALILHDKYKE